MRASLHFTAWNLTGSGNLWTQSWWPRDWPPCCYSHTPGQKFWLFLWLISANAHLALYCWWLLLSFVDNFCKQFGPRSGLTICRSWSGSKQFGNAETDSVLEHFEKLILKKSQQTRTKVWKIIQHTKSERVNLHKCDDWWVPILCFQLIWCANSEDSIRSRNGGGGSF